METSEIIKKVRKIEIKTRGLSSNIFAGQVNCVVEAMGDHFQDDDSVLIPTFGTFEVKKKLERIMVNPSTGQRMLVPPKLVLTFKPNVSWKERVKNGGAE